MGDAILVPFQLVRPEKQLVPNRETPRPGNVLFNPVGTALAVSVWNTKRRDVGLSRGDSAFPAPVGEVSLSKFPMFPGSAARRRKP